ncbi:MAG: hypothetical protein HZB23_15550 [Deltaproteobacteria bacterium]|nr:hypothetical protein [Deltaproteobacteria bacterium]
MKKILLALLLLALAIPGMANAAATTGVVTLLNAQAISAGDTYTSSTVNLTNAEGLISWYIELTGDGTASFVYQTSNDGVSFAEPEGVTAVVSGFTKTSGGSANGKAMEQISVEFARYMRVLVTETGGAEAIAVTLKMAVR